MEQFVKLAAMILRRKSSSTRTASDFRQCPQALRAMMHATRSIGSNAY
jgi:hypothetical protein